MKFIDYKANKSIRKDIEELYVSAFPIEERPPVNMFFSKSLKKNNSLLGIYEGKEFIGFTDLIFYKDICYIFFLAVADIFRNKGYGSKILKMIKDSNPDKTLILCYEEIDDKYPDIELRKRRRDFYYRNGFKNNNLKTCEYGVRYDTCYNGSHQVYFKDYLNLFVHNYGIRARLIIKEVK